MVDALNAGVALPTLAGGVGAPSADESELVAVLRDGHAAAGLAAAARRRTAGLAPITELPTYGERASRPAAGQGRRPFSACPTARQREDDEESACDEASAPWKSPETLENTH